MYKIANSKKTQALYIITSPERTGQYKIGKHTGTRNQLLSRYGTFLINPQLIYFLEHPRADILEKHVLYKLHHMRIVNNRGNCTEWVHSQSADYLIDIINSVKNTIEPHTIEPHMNDKSTIIDSLVNRTIKYWCISCHAKYMGHLDERIIFRIGVFDSIHLVLCPKCAQNPRKYKPPQWYIQMHLQHWNQADVQQKWDTIIANDELQFRSVHGGQGYPLCNCYDAQNVLSLKALEQLTGCSPEKIMLRLNGSRNNYLVC